MIDYTIYKFRKFTRYVLKWDSHISTYFRSSNIQFFKLNAIFRWKMVKDVFFLDFTHRWYLGSHFLVIFAEIWIRYFLDVYDDSYQDYLKSCLTFWHKFEILQYFGDELYSGKSISYLRVWRPPYETAIFIHWA